MAKVMIDTKFTQALRGRSVQELEDELHYVNEVAEELDCAVVVFDDGDAFDLKRSAVAEYLTREIERRALDQAE